MLQRFFVRRTMPLFVLLLFPWPALAMPAISISFAGNSTFVISATNLENVGKIDATISYDPSLLGNPRLTPKSAFQGTTVTMDESGAGNIHVVITSGDPMNGKGAFGLLAFDPIGASIGAISSFNGTAYRSDGKSLSVIFDVINPTPQLDPSDPDDAAMIDEREKKGQSFMGGDVAYLPPEADVVMEHHKQPDPSEEGNGTAATSENKASPSAESEDCEHSKEKSPSEKGTRTEKDTSPPVSSTQSVLERFRIYHGERTPKKLMALFAKASGEPFSQEPPILLADGKESVRVTISNVAAGKVPTLVFTSARFVSLQRVSETEWLVEARPEKGTVQASILIDDGKQRLIPLAVAPKAHVDTVSPGKVTEEDFELFLNERGTASAPKHDLNGDGKRDYLDDYIFTANYLLTTRIARQAVNGSAPPTRENGAAPSFPDK